MQLQQSPSARPNQAAQLLGIGESTLWRWAQERADFPKPRKLGPRTTVWDVAELMAWRDAQGAKAAA
jgi:prophage regulatory protein